VKYAFHALALHERRAPYMPTMMHVPENSDQVLVQTWFVGNHGDLGKERESRSLMEYPVAALLQHVKIAVPGLVFNEEALKEWFPSYGTNSSEITPFTVIHRPSWLMALAGQSVRVVGNYAKDGYRTNEDICSSVCRFEHVIHQNLVPSFRRTIVDGQIVWVNNHDSQIPEAPKYQFMSTLLGWS
jgi:Uncharacterized alpha/beta hydrolase domain (DUF2235)